MRGSLDVTLKMNLTMQEHNKRWLISMLKTSGSKRKYVSNGNYAEERHWQAKSKLDELPQRESIKSTQKFYNGKVNYGLLVRFLRGQVGNDWNEVYFEIISRIPTKLLDYKEMVYWFVADQVEIVNSRPWNKKSQRFIWTGEDYEVVHHTKFKEQPEFTEFYVDPITNKLVRIEKAFKKPPTLPE